MNEEILKIEGLRKSFGDFCAIDGVDLAIKPKVITSIIGPNGAGKTTIINLVTGYLRPDKGKIFFKEKDITRLAPHKMMKTKISRSFQVMNIFSRLTVFQNVELALLPFAGKSMKWFRGSYDLPDINKEVNRILETVQLSDKKDTPVGKISHGDQRLLEMGIAIAPKPELCFLDEPSSGMGRSEAHRVAKLIRMLADEKKTTFVIVEHDMDMVFSLSDWIIVMNRGKVLTEGVPEQIKGNKEVQEVYLGHEV